MSGENKKSKKYIFIVLFLVVILVITIPIILKLVVSHPDKNTSPNDSTSSSGYTDKAKNSDDKSSENKTDQTKTANGPIEEKSGITLNSYTGHGLDGSSYGTNEIFSTMKSSTLPTYGECYIVAVNNETTGEVIKIFSATGYELKMAFAGNSLDDVIEKFDID